MSVGWILLAPALTLPPVLPAAEGRGASLAAAAAASGRPPECSSRSRRAIARGPSIWELVRVPNLQRYCDLVARAQTLLGSAPLEAKKAAEQAESALGGHAAPQVVIARASLELGAFEEAARAFARARRIDPRSVEDPLAMHDLGRALSRTGKRDEALATYRALVPRADLLRSADARVTMMLEAAHLSMTVEATGGPLPSPAELVKPRAEPRRRLDEALAYLREARQQPPTPRAGDVLLSLALVLDRAGAREEADAALDEAQRAGVRPRPDALDYLAAQDDRAALLALAAERTDRAAAQKGWETFLAGPGGKGPWAAAARSRLDAIKRGGGAAAKPRKPR